MRHQDRRQPWAETKIASQLSGGEAQRIKLAKELARSKCDRVLWLGTDPEFDWRAEPTSASFLGIAENYLV